MQEYLEQYWQIGVTAAVVLALLAGGVAWRLRKPRVVVSEKSISTTPKTQLSLMATPTRVYGSFSGKSESSGACSPISGLRLVGDGGGLVG